MDKSGRELVRPIYTYIGDFKNGLACAQKGGLWGALDITGREVIPFRYDTITVFTSGVARIRQNGKWGAIATDGNVIHLNQYDFIGRFVHGHAWANIGNPTYNGRPDTLYNLANGRWFILDTAGHATPFITAFDTVYDFHYGFARVEKDRKMGVINSNGKVIVPLEFDYVSDYQEGVFWTNIDKENRSSRHWKNWKKNIESGLWGFHDASGKEIWKPQFNSGQKFNEGVAWVTKNGKYLLLDKKGNIILPATKYKTVQNFQNGVAWVINEGDYKWKLIDLNGNTLIAPKYEYIQDFYQNVCMAKGNEYSSSLHLIDTNGNIIARINLTYSFRLKDTYSRWYYDEQVKKTYNDYLSFLLKNKTRLAEPLRLYNDIRSFNNGVAWAKRSGAWGLIDTSGEVLFESISINNVYDFIEKNAWVNAGNPKKWGLCSKDGGYVIPPKYDYVGQFSEGIAWVNTGGKHQYNNENEKLPIHKIEGGLFGFVNHKGKEIMPPQELAELHEFKDGVAWVKPKTGYYWKLIDTAGSFIQLPADIEDIEYVNDFENGVAEITPRFNKVINIDKKGNIVESQLNCMDGTAWAEKGGKFGLWNCTERTFLPLTFKYKNYENFKNGLAKVKSENGWGVVDKKGIEVVPARFEKIEILKDNFIRVSKGEKWGLFNKQGKTICLLGYSYIGDYHNDVIPVNIGGRFEDESFSGGLWGLIDTTGVKVIPCMHNGRPIPMEGIYTLYHNRKMGIYLPKEKKYIPPEFDDISQIKDAWIMAKRNGNWGWIDKGGKTLINCTFEMATQFNQFNSDGQAGVSLFGKIFQINYKGEILWPRK